MDKKLEELKHGDVIQYKEEHYGYKYVNHMALILITIMG